MLKLIPAALAVAALITSIYFFYVGIDKVLAKQAQTKDGILGFEGFDPPGPWAPLSLTPGSPLYVYAGPTTETPCQEIFDSLTVTLKNRTQAPADWLDDLSSQSDRWSIGSDGDMTDSLESLCGTSTIGYHGDLLTSVAAITYPTCGSADTPCPYPAVDYENEIYPDFGAAGWPGPVALQIGFSAAETKIVVLDYWLVYATTQTMKNIFDESGDEVWAGIWAAVISAACGIAFCVMQSSEAAAPVEEDPGAELMS